MGGVDGYLFGLDLVSIWNCIKVFILYDILIFNVVIVDGYDVWMVMIKEVVEYSGIIVKELFFFIILWFLEVED